MGLLPSTRGDAAAFAQLARHRGCNVSAHAGNHRSHPIVRGRRRVRAAQGRAIDFGGRPAAMREFYREMSHTHPTELFYDPMGGMKHGHNIGAIGGHGNHVHVAY